MDFLVIPNLVDKMIIGYPFLLENGFGTGFEIIPFSKFGENNQPMKTYGKLTDQIRPEGHTPNMNGIVDIHFCDGDSSTRNDDAFHATGDIAAVRCMTTEEKVMSAWEYTDPASELPIHEDSDSHEGEDGYNSGFCNESESNSDFHEARYEYLAG